MPRLPIPTDLAALPVEAARSLLVPPVRALRHVAVAAARTVRHWEVVLSMASAPSDIDDDLDSMSAGAATSGQAHAAQRRRMGWDAEASEGAGDGEMQLPGTGGMARTEVHEEAPVQAPAPETVDLRDAGDLPVEDWAQLSLADAQARASSCSPSELATLLAYEQQHGHRMAFELMLQQKLRHEVG